MHSKSQGTLDRKLAALRAMATQTSGMLATVDLATYAAQVAEESFIEAYDVPRAQPEVL